MSKELLFKKGSRACICVSGADSGITRVASIVASDIGKVINVSRKAESRVVYSLDYDNYSTTNCYTVIYAGTSYEMNEYIKGRECYKISYETKDNKIIIKVIGSDKLGTIYGLYYLSSLSGVSPWHYFGDVKTPSRDVYVDSSCLSVISNEPKIKLRGFFLNDEWPSLGNWVHEKFGGFNELFYEKVFDLLLRLRGNFLWPAMWTGIFSDDGKAYPTAIASLADELGITMGTSHHEPLYRAGEEFTYLMSDSNEIGYGKDWSFYSNERGLTAFWDDSCKRNKDFKSLITIGMRGERDSKILGEDATLEDNINLLKKAILKQKEILRNNGLADATKVLALYKEVEDYFYGDENTSGLIDWHELDDTMLLLSDDNFGNLRTLPSDRLINRKAGFGIYYHFDYHGDPISYEWVNSTPITKAWEQLTTAYENGIRELWVVNVGDLRPNELPLSYFMALADNYDYWSEPNRTSEFLSNWVSEQFGLALNKEALLLIEEALNSYTRLNGDIRPEATHPDTLSFVEENEARRELLRCDRIDELINKAREYINPEAIDSFFGLVEFPCLASTNLRRMMIYKGMYDLMLSYKSSYSNELCSLINESIAIDKDLMYKYNKIMANGKWNHMMSSLHVDFKHWNDEGSSYPVVLMNEFKNKGKLLISIERKSPKNKDFLILTNLENETKEIWVMSTGVEEFMPSLTHDERLIVDIDSLSSTCHVINVSINWDYVKSNEDMTLTIDALGEKKSILISAEVYSSSCEEGSFIESTNRISMLSDEYVESKGQIIRIDNYGKTGVSMKSYPYRGSYSINEAPSLSYKLYINHEGEYFVSVRIAPTNNAFKGEGLKFGISIDNDVSEYDSLKKGFMAGYGTDADWCMGVLTNERIVTFKHYFGKGAHDLDFLFIDSGVVLQKIEISKTLSNSFYGIPRTFR